MCLRSDFPDWLICCGDGRGGKKKNLVNLCLWDLMLLPGAVLKMSFHPGGPPYLPHLDFWRVSDLKPGSLWICLFPSFPRGRPGTLRGQLTLPALQVQWMLQLGVDMLPERLPSFWICFPNLFHWWITHSHFLLYVWRHVIKGALFWSPASALLLNWLVFCNAEKGSK